MLKIVKYGEDEYGFPALVALGCFDALHIGHTELLKKAALQAKINGLDLGVMMFIDGKGGDQVYTFEEKLEMLEKYKVKFVLAIDFTEEFKQISATDFLKTLEERINVKGLMSGKDFRFGAGAKGKSSTLKNYAEDEENGVWYQSVKDVTYNDEKISTTLIKGLIESGDIRTADNLLGREYSVTGTVTEGASRGKELGFPTMNIVYPEKKVKVKEGVYEVECIVGDNSFKGIANYGCRPTFGEDNVILEVHLLDYEGENYGESVTVKFKRYIRDIVKFESAEELAEQLKEDLSGVKDD